jgi:apolipoprotein D and lipocalin family protein
VVNSGVVGGSQPIGATGTATPVSKQYGDGGAFKVAFPGSPPDPNECPGPNYIVQEYGGEYAIVQTAEWGILYILTREREPREKKVDVSLVSTPFLMR